MDKRRKWLAQVLEEGLRTGVIDPPDILRHATPAVLATDLPPTLVAKVLQAGIDGHGFDAHVVVESLGAEAIAEHIPLPVIWACIHETASVITAEHPLSQRGRGDGTEVSAPGAVQPDDVPDIEVLEG